MRTCIVCGCTDDDCRECIELTGKPCSWVKSAGPFDFASDVCSACIDIARAERKRRLRLPKAIRRVRLGEDKRRARR